MLRKNKFFSKSTSTTYEFSHWRWHRRQAQTCRVQLRQWRSALYRCLRLHLLPPPSRRALRRRCWEVGCQHALAHSLSPETPCLRWPHRSACARRRSSSWRPRRRCHVNLPMRMPPDPARPQPIRSPSCSSQTCRCSSCLAEARMCFKYV